MEYVTCPYEPKQVMPKSMLEAHLKLCPKFTQEKRMIALPFYSKDCNVWSPTLIAQSTDVFEVKRIHDIYAKVEQKWGKVYPGLFSIYEQV